MSRFKTIKTVASTLTIAVAVGFVMQYGEPAPGVGAAEAGPTYNKAPRTLMMSTNEKGQAVFGVPDVVTTPLDHASNVQPVVAVDVVYTELDVPTLGTILATPVIGCNTGLNAKRLPAAVIELTVIAPCFDDASFVVKHAGLAFSAVTDGDGNAIVNVPALVTDAAFSVLFENILQATTDIFVPELRQYDRAVLQWKNTNNMRLHAFEGGAQIGDPGHVWSASVHTAQDTREGRHGFVAYLGDAEADIPYQAEVYTFPAGQMNRNVAVDLRLGISVSEANCAREVEAQTIQTNAGETLVTSEIVIEMPSCDQVGEVVFLSNQFVDLKLASR